MIKCRLYRKIKIHFNWERSRCLSCIAKMTTKDISMLTINAPFHKVWGLEPELPQPGTRMVWWWGMERLMMGAKFGSFCTNQRDLLPWNSGCPSAMFRHRLVSLSSCLLLSLRLTEVLVRCWMIMMQTTAPVMSFAPNLKGRNKRKEKKMKARRWRGVNS